MSSKDNQRTSSIPGILAAMESLNASDLFISEGKVPYARIDGEIRQLKLAPTSAQNIEGFLALDQLYPSDGSCFCLSVCGDSMEDAGILNGDYAVVRQRPDFENGEIGVAVIDGEATVKRLRRRGRRIELIPANDKYKVRSINPREVEFRYAGEVIGVHRMLKR